MRLKAIIWILSAFIVGIFHAPASLFADFNRIEIRVLPESIVYGENYALGDIAELDGFDVETIEKLAKLEIGRSPVPGRSQLVYRGRISSVLRREFKENQFEISVPKKAMISRASLKVTKEQIEQLVLKEVKKQYEQFSDVKIDLTTRLHDVFIPKGKASYNIERIGKNNRIGGFSTWKLSLKLEDRVVKQVLIRVNVQVTDEVQVAKGVIEKGQSIAPTDLTTVKKDISKHRWEQLSDDEEELIVGQTARRAILENEEVKPSLVEQPRVIEKGNRVQLVYKSKNLYLTNLVVAMQSGKIGETIPVKTVNSRKTLFATIIDGRTVEVTL